MNCNAGMLPAGSRGIPATLPGSLTTDPITVAQHWLLALRAAIVAAAWATTYFGLNHLPVSLAIGWKGRSWPRNEFQWRCSIPLIAFSMLAGDYIFFAALRDPAALVSVVISVRRGSTLVAFAGGLWLFGKGNGWRKLPAVLGILAGIVLAVLG